jgi:hypothetical protein
MDHITYLEAGSPYPIFKYIPQKDAVDSLLLPYLGGWFHKLDFATCPEALHPCIFVFF